MGGGQNPHIPQPKVIEVFASRFWRSEAKEDVPWVKTPVWIPYGVFAMNVNREFRTTSGISYSYHKKYIPPGDPICGFSGLGAGIIGQNIIGMNLGESRGAALKALLNTTQKRILNKVSLATLQDQFGDAFEPERLHPAVLQYLQEKEEREKKQRALMASRVQIAESVEASGAEKKVEFAEADLPKML